MSGSKIGGLKAAKTNRETYGKDYYERIGSIGGKNGHTGGFASKIACHCSVIAGMHYIQNCAGAKGGTVSRRTR